MANEQFVATFPAYKGKIQTRSAKPNAEGKYTYEDEGELDLWKRDGYFQLCGYFTDNAGKRHHVSLKSTEGK